MPDQEGTGASLSPDDAETQQTPTEPAHRFPRRTIESILTYGCTDWYPADRKDLHQAGYQSQNKKTQKH